MDDNRVSDRAVAIQRHGVVPVRVPKGLKHDVEGLREGCCKEPDKLVVSITKTATNTSDQRALALVSENDTVIAVSTTSCGTSNVDASKVRLQLDAKNTPCPDDVSTDTTTVLSVGGGVDKLTFTTMDDEDVS